MNQLPQKVLEEQEWYQAWIEQDLKPLIMVGVQNSRWELLKMYHTLGEEIINHRKQFKESGIEKKGEIIRRVAASLGHSPRTIELAVRFVEKFPDINTIPDGNNASWHKLVNNYLSSGDTKKAVYIRGRVEEEEKAIYIPLKYKNYTIKYR